MQKSPRPYCSPQFTQFSLIRHACAREYIFIYIGTI
nr:MAG TPA: hypothetical protein [Caudoviricetes sp.]